MKTTGFTSFAEFWPYYLSEHRNPLNRRLHFVGTTLFLGLVVAVIVTGDWRLAPLWPVAGYSFAWAGHFLVEKNRPATFRHPIWSFLGDMKMYAMMWTGRLWGPAAA
jgi:hypothetical protein